MLKIFGSPLRYIQGPEALGALGKEVSILGQRALVIADSLVIKLIGKDVISSLESAGLTYRLVEFSGSITYAEITRLCEFNEAFNADIVIAAGGGKGIDAGKAVALKLGTKLVSVPTVASNDAPTSRLCVMYDEDHRVVGVDLLPTNPHLVLVDTTLIAKAPPFLLAAGIGDAIAKHFEVEQCTAAEGNSLFATQPLVTASILAKACYDIIMSDAVAGMRVAGTGKPDAAFERLIEACVLLSGLSFENGGLSIAHAMTRGLTAVHGSRDALHGQIVAYGLLVQWRLEGRDASFLHEHVTHYKAIGLATSLKDLGLEAPTTEELQRIVELSLATTYAHQFSRNVNPLEMLEAMNWLEEFDKKLSREITPALPD